MCLRVNIAINTIVYYIYVWIFQNGVEFEAKLFRLPAGNKAFAVLEKAGGAPSRRVGAESPEAWLPAATIREPRHYPLGGGEGHREWPFAQ